ncbi:MAG TPA: NAD(P)-binding domain-containing protein [Casimicrobiaceae bacterium]|nr:NAD(P)-binding domain-containing protein [Casimicrobiaceae bacterium]
MPERVETVVIGAGQAGLAMSRELAERGCEHVVLERARVAERWRTQRWDSLRFQFPNWSIELPGARYDGDDPEGFAPRDAIVAWLERYRGSIGAPVRTNVDVLSLAAARGDRYLLRTSRGDLEARNVVVATGPYQRPRVPAMAASLPGDIAQVHAADYTRPAALPDGAVLVIGTGASGCQIAEELLEAGREVVLAVGRHRRVPRRYRGRDVFWWRRELGQLDVRAEDVAPEQRPPPPLVTGVHGGHEIDLRAYAARGMRLVGHVAGVSDRILALAADLHAHLDAGDRACDAFKAEADAFVARHGLDLPQEPATAPPRGVRSPATLDRLDLDRAGIRAIVWATGYTTDFRWIGLPIVDEHGGARHRRGTSEANGVSFLGLPWLATAKSSFLCGVGADAAHLAERIAARDG